MSQWHDVDREYLAALKRLPVERLQTMFRYSRTMWRTVAIKRELIRRGIYEPAQLSPGEVGSFDTAVVLLGQPIDSDARWEGSGVELRYLGEET